MAALEVTATCGHLSIFPPGGGSLTSRGTVWGTSPSPTGNALAEGGTGLGVFTHGRTGLPVNTLLYYRGYAVNSVGTRIRLSMARS